MIHFNTCRVKIGICLSFIGLIAPVLSSCRGPEEWIELERRSFYQSAKVKNPLPEKDVSDLGGSTFDKPVSNTVQLKEPISH